MADAMSALQRRAKEYLQQIGDKEAQLHKELADLKRQTIEKQAEINSAGKATERFLSFDPSLGGNLQCPYCWVVNQVRSDLHTAPGGTDDNDEYACPRCMSSFTVEV